MGQEKGRQKFKKIRFQRIANTSESSILFSFETDFAGG